MMTENNHSSGGEIAKNGKKKNTKDDTVKGRNPHLKERAKRAMEAV